MKITILVVDDDSVSLAIVSAMLRKWSYEVAAVNDPVNALSILRERPGRFDLVVTDLHMPQMDGIQLQKHIYAEFQVPVIIMSSDDKESVILDSLALGAAFFIVKPINPVDLKNVWQHAVAAKKGKSLPIQNMSSNPAQPPWPDKEIRPSSSVSSGARAPSDDGQSESSFQGYQSQRKDCKRKTRDSGDRDDDIDDDDDDDDDEADDRPHPPAPKKAKVVWTNSLHNRFLQAIRHIGLDRAVPKKILEFMNVPGLTRENVASHLQKYRMFLKRVAEKTASATDTLTEKTLKSSFASGHEFSLLELAQEYSRLKQHQQTMSQGTFPAGLVRSATNLSSTGVASMHIPTQAAPTNTCMPQLGFRQPNPSSNQYNNLSTFQSTNSWTGFGEGTGNCTSSLSANKVRVNNYAGAPAGTTLANIGSSCGYGRTTNQGASNYLTSLNQVSNSYAGIRISSNGELLGMGQIGNRVDGLAAGFGFVNRIGNSAAAGDQTSGVACGGIEDYEFDLMNDDAFTLDNITNSQQQMGGSDLAPMLLHQNNFQQNGDCDQLVNQLLNSDFSTICSIEDGGKNEMEGEVTDNEQSSVNPKNKEAASCGNQSNYSDQDCWEDDFLDSIFGFD